MRLLNQQLPTLIVTPDGAAASALLYLLSLILEAGLY